MIEFHSLKNDLMIEFTQSWFEWSNFTPKWFDDRISMENVSMIEFHSKMVWWSNFTRKWFANYIHSKMVWWFNFTKKVDELSEFTHFKKNLKI